MQSWPANLPQCSIRNGFKINPTENVVRSKTAVGPGKVRARATFAPIKVPPSVIVTHEEYEQVASFWRDNLESGALRFLWPFLDGIIGGSRSYAYQFDAPFQATPFGQNWKVDMQLSAWPFGPAEEDGLPFALVFQLDEAMHYTIKQFVGI